MPAKKPSAKKASAKPAAKAKEAGKKRKPADEEQEEVPTPSETIPKDPLMTGKKHGEKGECGAYQANEVKAGQLNIVSWNVNGIRALLKKGPLLKVLAERENPDVVVLQETKIDVEELAKQDFSDMLPGYTAHWNCCSTKKGYSGTAVFLRKDHAKLKVTTDDLGGDLNEEGRIQLVHFNDFVLINTYVPNSGQKLERLSWRTQTWDAAVRKLLVKLRDAGKGVVWTGDLNVSHRAIDVAKPNKRLAGFTPEERASFTETLGLGFVDTFRKLHPAPEHHSFYSYWGYRGNMKERNGGWRLDYYVVDEAFSAKVVASSILPAYNGSDHCPVQCILDAN